LTAAALAAWPLTGRWAAKKALIEETICQTSSSITNNVAQERKNKHVLEKIGS
jgi:hypothetical protein